MSLSGTLDRIERTLKGGNGEGRKILIAPGPWYEESWVERLGPTMLYFFLRTPRERWDRAYVMDHLRRLMRPGDSVTIFEMIPNGRDVHLQGHLPPWKRRPYRLIDSGQGDYELEIDGVWVRFEGTRHEPEGTDR